LRRLFARAILNRMAQKRSGRGRPPIFKRDQALEEAIGLFWRRGYEAASLTELENCTGLNRSSLYNSFGSKHDLFSLALERYARMLTETVVTPLEDGTKGLDDLHAFVARVRASMAGPGASDGCFLVNSMVEFGGSDGGVSSVGERHFTRLGKALGAALNRAAEAGETGGGPVEDRANALMGLIIGVLATVRAQAPAGQVEGFFAAAAALIDSWREH
jgi:AcrR family transcriptional regulator